MSARYWRATAEIRDGIGEPIKVEAEFDRWNLIPSEALERLLVGDAEVQEQTRDGRDAEKAIRLERLWAELFDGCCRKLLVDGEAADVSEVATSVRADIAMQLWEARQERGKEQSPPSSAT